MKKLFLILLVAMSASLAITSCSDDSVKPGGSQDNGGGGASDPILP